MKIAFADFWDNFNPQDNFLTNAFRRLTDITIVKPSERPDILVYSFFGYENLKYHDCVRLYYTGENDVPDFNLCDYAISFHHLQFGFRHLRLPLYATFPSFKLMRDGRRMGLPKEERSFCSFVVSNNFCATPLRTEIFNELSKYKFVASGGRYANNIGGPVKDKLCFLNGYKFNIAFENSRVEGYTTEKLLDALASYTVPIYWGDPNVAYDVNPESFINVNDFSSIDEAIRYIKEVDENDEIYNRYLNVDPLVGNPYLHWENILDSFLKGIIDDFEKKVPLYGLGAQIHINAFDKEDLFHNKHLRNLLNLYRKIRR